MTEQSRSSATLGPSSSSSALPHVEIDGCGYEYDDVPGAPDRAPLLFLHEGLGSVGLWRGFHRHVAAATGRRTVAYSRLGHGYSDLPPAKRGVDFAHVEATTVVPALIEALGLQEPVLVGHSDGASIALLAAAALPVRGLVVLAPHVIVEEVGLASIRKAREAFESGDLRRRMERHHRSAEVCFRGWNDVWLDPAFTTWDLRPALSDVTCPVLGVQGDDDPYGTIVHVEEVRRLASGPVELLLPHCGHAPHLERPHLVEGALAGFVQPL